MAETKKKTTKKATATVKLIKMVTDDGKTANVHPDMVEEYKKGGYK